MGSSSRVTLKQIAERVGCSVTAVSKTINGAKGTAGVSQATRERVWEVARELGYTPNYLAQALQRGRSGAVGLVSQLALDMTHDLLFWQRIVLGLERVLSESNQDLLIIASGREGDEVARALDSLRQGRVDALIVPARQYNYRLDDFADIPDKLVDVGMVGPGPHPCAIFDERPGIKALLSHLAQLGHRAVIWMPHVADGVLDWVGRDETMRAEADALGLELVTWPLDLSGLAEPVPSGEILRRARDLVAGQLQKPLPGTALVTFSERSALGALRALCDAGLHCPAQISLASFDDLYAELVIPSLTTIDTALDQVGASGAELALLLAAGELDLTDPPRVAVPSRLIVRESTGPAPK